MVWFLFVHFSLSHLESVLFAFIVYLNSDLIEGKRLFTRWLLRVGKNTVWLRWIHVLRVVSVHYFSFPLLGNLLVVWIAWKTLVVIKVLFIRIDFNISWHLLIFIVLFLVRLIFRDVLVWVFVGHARFDLRILIAWFLLLVLGVLLSCVLSFKLLLSFSSFELSLKDFQLLRVRLLYSHRWSVKVLGLSMHWLGLDWSLALILGQLWVRLVLVIGWMIWLIKRSAQVWGTLLVLDLSIVVFFNLAGLVIITSVFKFIWNLVLHLLLHIECISH